MAAANDRLVVVFGNERRQADIAQHCGRDRAQTQLVIVLRHQPLQPVRRIQIRPFDAQNLQGFAFTRDPVAQICDAVQCQAGVVVFL